MTWQSPYWFISKDLNCVIVIVVRRRLSSVPIEFPRKCISYIALVLFTVQASRGFAMSRLCSDEDVISTNRTILYLLYHGVGNDTSKKGGTAPRATD